MEDPVTREETFEHSHTVTVQPKITGLLSTAKSTSPKFTIVPSLGTNVTTPDIGELRILLSVCLKVPLYSSFFANSPFCIATVVSSRVLLLEDISVF